jgi:transposase-like protein
MGTHITKSELLHSAADTSQQLFGDWFDPIEMRVRERVRGFIEELIETELEETLSRPRYGRAASVGARNAPCGHRHGHRSRTVMGTFGRVEIKVPRARLNGGDGKTTEWKSKTLPAYQRRTQAADALIASAYLAGTIRAGYVARSRRCLAARSARTW